MVTSATRAKRLDHYRKVERARQREHRARVRAAVTAYKAEHGCARCPERRPDALHFHHPDRLVKQRTVSVAIATRTERQVWEEIGRCELLCASCHQVEHAREHRERIAREGLAT